MGHPSEFDEPRILSKQSLPRLFEVLQEDGYRIAGPALVDGVLAFRPMRSASELARGITDEQEPGRYRLKADEDGHSFFQNVVGADGAKRFFFPPESELFAFRETEHAFDLVRTPEDPPAWALFGLRPCDLAAIRIQDRVFGYGEDERPFRCEAESYYAHARMRSLLLVVHCLHPGGNCFCDSWGTGPRAAEGFDLAFTELRDSFCVESGSSRGASILERLETTSPHDSELELAALKLERAREHMGRRLQTEGLKTLVEFSIHDPIWEELAQRCLGCGNCTMVCPTCFCSTVMDSNDLETGVVARTRRWESCFTHQFSYVTSGPVRSSTAARYRHWLRHKLSMWWDQFESSGCVGCGRCLTWCPVGIDWTITIRRLQQEAVRREPAMREGAS